MSQRGSEGTKAKVGEGRIHREGMAGAKALRQDCTSEQIKGCAAGGPGGREEEMGKTTFLCGHSGVVRKATKSQAHISPPYYDSYAQEAGVPEGDSDR